MIANDESLIDKLVNAEDEVYGFALAPLRRSGPDKSRLAVGSLPPFEPDEGFPVPVAEGEVPYVIIVRKDIGWNQRRFEVRRARRAHARIREQYEDAQLDRSVV